ncbi:hypothetical protein FB451DRAFT_959524, partial [Mycena latifolia]
IPELVDIICYLMYPEDRRGLAVLARTSKAFQDVALHVQLWRSQSTFANILRCMPDDLWG